MIKVIPTPQLYISAAAVFLVLIPTLGPLLDFGVAFTPSNTQMKIEPRKGDLVVIQSSKCTSPLLTDFSGPSTSNPYTRYTPNNGSMLPPPPPPPLELPQLPALPLPEKDK